MREAAGGREGGGGEGGGPHKDVGNNTFKNVSYCTFRKVLPQNVTIPLQISEGPTLNVTYIFEGGFHKM